MNILKIDDGQVTFATYIIRAEVDWSDVSLRSVLPPLQIEEEGIIVYSDQELQEATATLDFMEIPYVVEKLTVDPAIATKVEGVNYNNCSEAVAHITNDEVPESLVIPNMRKLLDALQRNNEELKSRVKVCEDALLGVIFKNFKGAPS